MVNQSIELANWIKNAELINRAALCKEVGIDRANLDKYLQRGAIPEKFIAALGKALYKYGYKEVVKSIVEENNKPENKERIEKERSGITEKRAEPKDGDIEKQITAIKSEKIPEHRNTPMGRKVWAAEQQKRISELESKK